jgi:hypothetical protein
MGHSTRCLPLIRKYSLHNKVIIGTTIVNREYFNEQLPDVSQFALPSYNIRYSRILPAWLMIVLQALKIYRTIRNENKLLKKVIRENNADLVISDNRFGCFNASIESVIITHQLNIMGPLSCMVNFFNHMYLARFNKIWVPDYLDTDKRLSGALASSSQRLKSTEYIGPLSALAEGADFAGDQIYDVLVLLSGPEPQRTELEKLLVDALSDSGKTIAFVRGTIRASSLPVSGMKFFGFVSGDVLRQLILRSGTVVCRSGYSTLMDLHLLRKKNIVLVPTPGQSEQEYLAQYWEKKFGAKILPQNEISRKDVLIKELQNSFTP